MRRLAISIAVIAVMIGAGYASNIASRRQVERERFRVGVENASFTARLWHLRLAEIRVVPMSALRFRTEDVDGHRVTFQVLPAFDPPFAYAYAESLLPFTLRVHAGWAVAGRHMAFGEGGDYFVVSFFGLWSKTVKEQPHWAY